MKKWGIGLSWILIWFAMILCAQTQQEWKDLGVTLWISGVVIQGIIGGLWLWDKFGRDTFYGPGEPGMEPHYQR